MNSGKFILGFVFVCIAAIGIIPLFFRDYKYFKISEKNRFLISPISAQRYNVNNLAPPYDPGNDVLGSYNNISVKRSDLTTQEKQNLFNAENQTYRTIENIIEKRYFNSLVAEYMKKNHISNLETAHKSFILDAVKVTKNQLKSFLQQSKNKPQLKGKTLDQQEELVLPVLQKHAEEDYYNEIITSALASGSIQVTGVKKPGMLRVDINLTHAPFKGTDQAPVTIVEFADFQSHFCADSESVIDKVMKEYDGKIKFVFKNFPLTQVHPESIKAAIAAKCADKQNKYWPVHDALFKNSENLNDAIYDEIAKENNLDLTQFNVCRKDPEIQASIAAELNYGRSLEINKIPAFYINGIQLTGVQPKSEFERIINAELKAQY